MKTIWYKLFLEERPSISLSFFRLAAALTTGFHVIPTFFHLEDTYFQTAFKRLDPSFFTIGVLEWVQKSPEPLIMTMVWVFLISWFFFLIGFLSQLSCIIMYLSCLYFYALNAFHVGTLSWDILLVTLFLMCITPYHGDYFSMDCLLKKDTDAYKKLRPYFVQRLLQMQIGFTYFYTALYKVSAEGNWIHDNPLYYVLNYPPAGVTKTFLIRDFIMDKPEVCYWLGIVIVVIEFSMLFLLFWKKTRISAIYLGFLFHVTLILTLDVPAIFFFLFPTQLLLFIDPKDIVIWIDQKRSFNSIGKHKTFLATENSLPMQQRRYDEHSEEFSCQQRRGESDAPMLLYDGRCQFCQISVKRIQTLDLFATLSLVDLHSIADLKKLHPQLTQELAMSQFHLIEPNGKIYGGFDVFRRICFTMPMLYPMIFVFYFPGMRTLGALIYKFIAKNRYLFHFNKTCQNNACYIK